MKEGLESRLGHSVQPSLTQYQNPDRRADARSIMENVQHTSHAVDMSIFRAPQEQALPIGVPTFSEPGLPILSGRLLLPLLLCTTCTIDAQTAVDQCGYPKWFFMGIIHQPAASPDVMHAPGGLGTSSWQGMMMQNSNWTLLSYRPRMCRGLLSTYRCVLCGFSRHPQGPPSCLHGIRVHGPVSVAGHLNW
jgi:hypothetical protein